MKKFVSGIRNKHPGSAALLPEQVFLIIFQTYFEMTYRYKSAVFIHKLIFFLLLWEITLKTE
jgi:hypothetical protein